MYSYCGCKYEELLTKRKTIFAVGTESQRPVESYTQRKYGSIEMGQE